MPPSCIVLLCCDRAEERALGMRRREGRSEVQRSHSRGGSSSSCSDCVRCVQSRRARFGGGEKSQHGGMRCGAGRRAASDDPNGREERRARGRVGAWWREWVGDGVCLPVGSSAAGEECRWCGVAVRWTIGFAFAARSVRHSSLRSQHRPPPRDASSRRKHAKEGGHRTSTHNSTRIQHPHPDRSHRRLFVARPPMEGTRRRRGGAATIQHRTKSASNK